MRLHEQLNRRLLERLAAKDLCDHAFQLTPVTLVNQPGGPVHDGVGTGDQRRHSGNPPAHQLSGVNPGAVGPAELGPRQHVRQKCPHDAGSCCTQRDPAQVEPMVGDRQTVSNGWHQQVLLGYGQTIKPQPVVIGMPQGMKPIVDQLEVFVLFPG